MNYSKFKNNWLELELQEYIDLSNFVTLKMFLQ